MKTWASVQTTLNNYFDINKAQHFVSLNNKISVTKSEKNLAVSRMSDLSELRLRKAQT